MGMSIVHVKTITKFLMKVAMAPSTLICDSNIKQFENQVTNLFGQPGAYYSVEEFAVKFLTHFATLTGAKHDEDCKDPVCRARQSFLVNCQSWAMQLQLLPMDLDQVTLWTPLSLKNWYDGLYKQPVNEAGE